MMAVMERRMSSEVVGVRILRREDSIEVRIVDWMLSKEPVFTPMSSRSTPSQRRTAASRATFFFRRCSSMAFMGLSRSAFVRSLPPMILRNMPLKAPRLEFTRPPESDCVVSGLLESALANIEWTSSSKSFRTKSPFLVLVPCAPVSIESISVFLCLSVPSSPSAGAE